MSQNLLIEPHYFGSIEFFGLILTSEKITLDIHHHYLKQTYRNRCDILTPPGIRSLSVPVSYKNHTPYRDVTIDHSQSWARDHWGAIISAYGKAPFFEFFADYFAPLYSRNHHFLLDLSVETLTICLKMIQVKREIGFTESYQEEASPGILDLRGQISPKKPLNSRPWYVAVPYSQVFGKEFVPNLSLLDLLFCEGTETRTILIKSINPRLNI